MSRPFFQAQEALNFPSVWSIPTDLLENRRKGGSLLGARQLQLQLSNRVLSISHHPRKGAPNYLGRRRDSAGITGTQKKT
jgi:hypothetical protein